MRTLLISITLLFSLQVDAFAQHPTVDKQPPFVTYMEIGAGLTGIELGVSARVRERLATGFFAMRFHNSSFNNIEQDFTAGLRGKYYLKNGSTKPYVGPMLGLHGFQKNIRPFVGLNTGFDVYSGEGTTAKGVKARLGFELHGGINTEGNGFMGLSLIIGFGWNGEPLDIEDYQ